MKCNKPLRLYVAKHKCDFPLQTAQGMVCPQVVVLFVTLCHFFHALSLRDRKPFRGNGNSTVSY